MLKLEEINKTYFNHANTINALSDVTLEFRESEFVSILGPSGCGKTTLLNIIGGLDRYTDGDLIINGISTKCFDEKHWDAYRNATVGFVFQSYNLIPHLNVLQNVEIALCLAGVKRKDRKALAIKSLERVGVANEMLKKPMELSGGQMQRVAIARALVNNPKIILADEPTGALDSELGLQVMDLLKEISKERLVVLVTHDSDIAKEFSDRIIRIKDGRVIEDSNPIAPEDVLEQTPSNILSDEQITNSEDDTKSLDEKREREDCCQCVDTKRKNEKKSRNSDNNIAASRFLCEKKFKKQEYKQNKISNRKKKGFNKNEIFNAMGSFFNGSKKKFCNDLKPSSMSFFTSIRLSFNNLWNKKKRTTMTVLAGSIGVIGLGLVLAFATGFNTYIANGEKTIFGMLPVGIYEYNLEYDFVTQMLNNFKNDTNVGDFKDDGKLVIGGDKVGSSVTDDFMNNLSTFVGQNKLTPEFGNYIKNLDKATAEAVNVVYGTQMNMITRAKDNNGVEFYQDVSPSYKNTSALNIVTSVFGENTLEPNGWNQLVGGKKFMEMYYEVLEGHYPVNKNEIVLVIDGNNTVSKTVLQQFGIDIYKRGGDGKVILDTFNMPTIRDDITFSEIIGDSLINNKIKLIANDDYYQKTTPTDPDSYFRKPLNNQSELQTIYNSTDNIELNVVGVLRVKPNARVSAVGCNFCYTPELGEYIKNKASESKVAIKQNELIENDINRTAFDEEMPKDVPIETSIDKFLNNVLAKTSFLKAIGVDSSPKYIKIYPSTYKMREAIENKISAWNTVNDEKIKEVDVAKIYTHNVKSLADLMRSILIGVAAISLVVSVVMLGIITSNSVIERTHEIGILRSLGARKLDIAWVFLSETSILGCGSGLFGIVTIYALCPLISLFIEKNLNIAGFLIFKPLEAFILFSISFLLTIISGVMPAISASRKNVVDAIHVD